MVVTSAWFVYIRNSKVMPYINTFEGTTVRLFCYFCLLGAHNAGSFDVVLSGVDASPHVHSADCLAELARVLKPSGKALLREPTVKEGM